MTLVTPIVSRYLLDTNMLLGFVRRAPWATRIWKEDSLADSKTAVYISVVCRRDVLTRGEIRVGWKQSDTASEYS